MSRDPLTGFFRKKEPSLRPDLLTAVGAPIMSRTRLNVPYDLDDKDLEHAAMTAVVLGQPLLLAGNPGVGKSKFAGELANKLKLEMLEPFRVKSSNEGLDLFYRYDEVGRFRGDADAPKSSHVDFGALGRAILLSVGPDHVIGSYEDFGHLLARGNDNQEIQGETGDARAPNASEQVTLGQLFPKDFFVNGKRIEEPTRTVVLIDELDKAPRDAPNDILGEIENLEFWISELQLSIKAKPEFWPIVVITSNSERSLPDAFLRRCIFHWIENPTKERLIKIVHLHLEHHCGEGNAPALDSEFIKSAYTAYSSTKKKVSNKKPATAEFIGFTLALWARKNDAQASFSMDGDGDADVRQVIGTLLKTKTDRLQVYPDDVPAAS
ncbi:MAG: hypothetical protein AAFX02_00570 [Pseudomonadota bacterium]